MRRILKKTAFVAAALPFATLLVLPVTTANAAPFFFSSGLPDGRVGTGSRPAGAGGIEIESADDFILNQATSIDRASFYGLIPFGARINAVRLETYRVFPFDSTEPPSGRAPTRANSPSDVAFQERQGADLNYTTTDLGDFSVTNSVLDGINPFPNQTTGGDGPVNGRQVRFDVTLTTPFELPADHYFFIPQVELSNGDFLWLSSAKPIAAPGTLFAPDLQSWIRDGSLAPDWLRIGTDVIGNATGAGVQTFNAAFSLTGQTLAVPEPPVWSLFAVGMFALLTARREKRSQSA